MIYFPILPDLLSIIRRASLSARAQLLLFFQILLLPRRRAHDIFDFLMSGYYAESAPMMPRPSSRRQSARERLLPYDYDMLSLASRRQRFILLTCCNRQLFATLSAFSPASRDAAHKELNRYNC